MVVHVQKIGDEFAVIIPPQVVDEFGLVDGSPLEIQPMIRYTTTERALRAFEDTLPQHEATYRELAK